MEINFRIRHGLRIHCYSKFLKMQTGTFRFHCSNNSFSYINWTVCTEDTIVFEKKWYNSADHRKSIFSIRKFFQSQYFSFSIKKRMEMWHCQYSIQFFLKYQVWILHGLHNRVRGIIFYEILYIWKWILSIRQRLQNHNNSEVMKIQTGTFRFHCSNNYFSYNNWTVCTEDTIVFEKKICYNLADHRKSIFSIRKIFRVSTSAFPSKNAWKCVLVNILSNFSWNIKCGFCTDYIIVYKA